MFQLYTEDKDTTELYDFFMFMAKSNRDFMQLRYIDKNGFEKVRLQRSKEGEKPIFIPQDRLQDKSKRYYFSNSKNKPLEKVWFSKIDLNEENGKVELPYRPTLRAILPLAKDGNFDGILIVNFFMDTFLKRLVNAPLYDMILADNKGFVIKHYDDSKNWGFYKKPQYTLQQDLPDFAEDIIAHTVLSNDTLVSRHLDLLPIDGGLILVMQLKQQYLETTIQKKYDLYIMISIMVFVLAFLLSIALSKSTGKLYGDLNKKLQKSRVKFFTLFKESLDPIVLVDIESQKFIEFNQKALDMYGYTKEEFKQVHVEDLEAQFNKEEIQEHQDRLKQRGWDKFVTKHKAKDGTLRDVSVSAVSIVIDDKLYLYGTLHDITKEKEYERNLQELLNRQEALMQIRTTGFVHIKDRRFVWTNEAFEKILGYDKGELQDVATRIMYYDDAEYEKYGRNGYKALAEVGVYTQEVKCIKKDGSAIFLLASMTALKGSPSEALGVATDITKERQQQELIKEQKEELETIFNISKDGIAILDLDSNFLDFNDAYLEMTGFTREELLQKSCFGLTDEEDAEKSQQAMKIVLQDGYIKSFNKRCLIKNGNKLDVNMSISLMPDKQRILVSTKDISEMKKYERELEYIAHFDPLTGLANRVLKADRLHQAMLHVKRYGGFVVVLYIDLDGFKEVNDQYGHDVGDQVLIEMSVRMKNTLRVGDTLARLGGDEFVAILVCTENEVTVFSILERLLATAKDEIVLGDKRMHVSASIGVTFYSQDDDLDGDQLLRQADQAMYMAKKSGKNR